MTPSRHTVCERCVQVRGRKPSSSDNADGVSTTPKTKRSRANSNPQICSCTTVLVFAAKGVVTNRPPPSGTFRRQYTCVGWASRAAALVCEQVGKQWGWNAVYAWRATPTPMGQAPLGTRRGGRAGRRSLCPLERSTSARKGGRRFKLRTPTRRREPRGTPGGPPQRILYKFCAALIVTVASIGNTKGWAGASDRT